MVPTGFNSFIGGVRTDLMDIFEPLGANTKLTYNTGFKSYKNANQDLTDLFKPYPGTGTKADITNYKVFSTGLDRCDTFQPTIFPTLTDFTTASGLVPQACCMYQNYAIILNNSTTMFRSANYGITFTTVSGSFAGSFRYVAMYQNNAIAVSTTSVYTSSDYGVTWTLRSGNGLIATTGYAGCAIYDVLMMVADQANGRLYFSTNGGLNWSFQSMNYPRGLAITKNGANYVVVVGLLNASSGGSPIACNICATFNPAVTSNTFSSTTYTGQVPFIIALDGQYGVCCSTAGASNKTIKYSTNYGQTWTDVTAAITTSCFSVSLSGGNAIVTTFSTTYYTSSDNGQTWTTRTSTDATTTAANYGTRFTSYTYNASTPSKFFYGVLG